MFYEELKSIIRNLLHIHIQVVSVLCYCRQVPYFWRKSTLWCIIWCQKALGITIWQTSYICTKLPLRDGFHHVAGGSPEAVHQLRDGGKRRHQERGQEEPVRPQEQLHPQEEHQQEEKPSLWQPESPRLVAASLPGGTEGGEVSWLTTADPW